MPTVAQKMSERVVRAAGFGRHGTGGRNGRPRPETPHSAIHRERAEAKRSRRLAVRRAVSGDRSGVVFRPSARGRCRIHGAPWKRAR